jgi:iron complex transport system substrate-binding protein
MVTGVTYQPLIWRAIRIDPRYTQAFNPITGPGDPRSVCDSGTVPVGLPAFLGGSPVAGPMVVLDFLREKGKGTMDANLPSNPRPSAGRGFSFVLVALIGLLVACAGPVAPSPAPTPTSPSASSPTPAATATPAPPTPAPTPAAAFPRTLVDDEGTTVEIAAEPQRIISLSPANTEIVFALGAGERLVGRTDFDDYPPEAAALPAVASFAGVILEQAVDLEPDLVLAAGNNFTPAGDIERMRELGLTVLVVYAETMEQVLADIRLIGQAIGADEEAEAIVAQVQARIDEVASATDAIGERPRVFYQIGSEPEIYAPAPDSFIADMVVLAGGDPITTTDPAVFSISVERLIDLDPEVIVLGDAAYGVCPDAVHQRPGWGSMTAVREDAIRPVDDIIITRPGPRLGEGLAALALAIHPDADISPPEATTPVCPEGFGGR